MVDRSGIIDGITDVSIDGITDVSIDGIIDGIIKRVGIIIKGMSIIVKGIVVIESVATFPETRLRHFPSLADVWKVVESM